MQSNGLRVNALIICQIVFCYAAQAQDPLRFAPPTTVLTIASSGAWGVGLHENSGVALAIAMAHCRTRDSRPASDCGAYLRSVQGGWLVGLICGRHAVIGYGATIEGAQAKDDELQDAVRREWRPDLPECDRIAVIEPDGRVDIDRSRSIAVAP